MFLTIQMVEVIRYRVLLTATYLITIPLIGYVRAWAFTKVGDSTPEQYGFLTVNPMVHISFLWLILLQFFGIGFGALIPIDAQQIWGPHRFGKLLFAYFSDAVASIFIALVALIFAVAFYGPDLFDLMGDVGSSLFLVMGRFLGVLIIFNVAMASFNIISNGFNLCFAYFYADHTHDTEHAELVRFVGVVVILIFAFGAINNGIFMFVRFLAHLIGRLI